MGTVEVKQNSAPKKARHLWIDRLRGLAVLFMFEAHVFDSWILPSLKNTNAVRWTSVIAGYAAAMFLMLAGVGMAMGLVGALKRGTTWEQARRSAIKRGFMLFLGALVFRLQEHLLGGGALSNLLRVDILNCIGVSMMLAAGLFWPRGTSAFGGGRAFAASLIIVLITPFCAQVSWTNFLPWPLASYIFDDRSWFFPLIPWSNYLLLGVGLGILWSRTMSDPKLFRRVMFGLFLVGAIFVGGSWLTLQSHDLKMLFLGGRARTQPSYLLTHIGWIFILCFGVWLTDRIFSWGKFSPVRQMGTTSLLMYWVHIDLVYGHLPGKWLLNLKGNLTFGQTLLALSVLTILMIGISYIRTSYFPSFKPSVFFEELWLKMVGKLRTKA